MHGFTLSYKYLSGDHIPSLKCFDLNSVRKIWSAMIFQRARKDRMMVLKWHYWFHPLFDVFTEIVSDFTIEETLRDKDGNFQIVQSTVSVVFRSSIGKDLPWDWKILWIS